MFVALVPPAGALEDLEEFLAPRIEAGPDLRWTGVEQWHVTLAFMADVPERSLDDLLVRLQRAAHRRTAFPAAVTGGGAFPHVVGAKVLWTGLDVGPHREELHRLVTGVRAAAAKSGAEAAGGRFHPHLTLARLRRPTEVTKWVRLLDAYRGPSWVAEEVTLIESHLGEGPRRRPRYEVVERFPLQPAPEVP